MFLNKYESQVHSIDTGTRKQLWFPEGNSNGAKGRIDFITSVSLIQNYFGVSKALWRKS